MVLLELISKNIPIIILRAIKNKGSVNPLTHALETLNLSDTHEALNPHAFARAPVNTATTRLINPPIAGPFAPARRLPIQGSTFLLTEANHATISLRTSHTTNLNKNIPYKPTFSRFAKTYLTALFLTICHACKMRIKISLVVPIFFSWNLTIIDIVPEVLPYDHAPKLIRRLSPVPENIREESAVVPSFSGAWIET
ncbi:MAG: hypothetical protein ABF533_04005 [Acetobacter persici]|uniref:hypothetical protein n=1 Tax=Acetobacter persici TaxID=1076596 RepID=UPI0039EB0212